MLRPTLHQLAVFLAVATHGSYSAAGRELHLAQSAVSFHVQQLEDLVGVELIEQLGKRLCLTPAGKVMLERSRRILALVDDSVAEASGLTGELCGRLTVGASSTPGTFLLPEALSRLRNEWPMAQVVVSLNNSRTIERRLFEHELDLGLMGCPPKRENLVAEVFATDDIVFIANPGHPLSETRSVSISKVLTEQIIVREPGSATRDAFAASLTRLGLELKPTMELDNTEAIKRAVRAGLGIAALSGYAVRDELKLGVLTRLKVRGIKLQRNLYVVRHRDKRLSGIAEKLLSYLYYYRDKM